MKKIFILFYLIAGVMFGCNQTNKIEGPFLQDEYYYFIENNDTIFFNQDNTLFRISFIDQPVIIQFIQNQPSSVFFKKSNYYFLEIDSNLQTHSISIDYPKGHGVISLSKMSDTVKHFLFDSYVYSKVEDDFRLIPEHSLFYINDVIDSINSMYYSYSYLDSSILVKNIFPDKYELYRQNDTLIFSDLSLVYQFIRGSIWGLDLTQVKNRIYVNPKIPKVTDIEVDKKPHLKIKIPLEYDYILMTYVLAKKFDEEFPLDYSIRAINKYYGSPERRDSIKNELEQVMNDFNDNNRVEYFMKKISNYNVIRDMGR